MSDEKSKVFEDEFMEVQSGLISLCMELVGEIAENIYVWCNIENGCLSFNFFVKVNGEIKTLGTLDLNRQKLEDCLDIGTMDLLKISRVCEKYNMPIPTEIKMYFDVKSGKFDAKYCYEEICSERDVSEVFMDWVVEMKQELGQE